MNENKFSFATLMASSTHDLKNILGSVLESLDWFFDSAKNLNNEQRNELEKVSQLIAHVNSELLQLLCFYKFENNQYQVSVLEQDIESFVNMQAAFFKPLIRTNKINFTQEFDHNLTWFFDDVLLTTAVRNAIMNAIKYAKSKVILSVDIVDNWLCISIEDDGLGYSQDMLGEVKAENGNIDPKTNSTGLGLFFASQVAKMHVSKDKVGYVKLSSSQLLGGAKLSIYIP